MELCSNLRLWTWDVCDSEYLYPGEVFICFQETKEVEFEQVFTLTAQSCVRCVLDPDCEEGRQI